MEFAAIKSGWGLDVSKNAWQQPEKPKFAALDAQYAFGFKWDNYLAPKMLNKLLQQGVQARVALSPLSAKSLASTQEFAAGSIIIPAGDSKKSAMGCRY